MAHRGRLNVLAHNLGRALRHDLRRVRGRLDARGGDHDPAGRHRRRQVPPRRRGLLRARRRRARSSCAWSPTRATSSTSRPVVEGATPRGADHAPGPARRTTTPTPRVPIVLHGDAAFPGQGVVAETLNLQALDGYTRRRHDPPDPEQPGRLHDRPRRRPLDPVGVGPGQGLRRPDHPRQRRRRGGVHRRRAAGLRLPPGVRPRRADRPDRLPPLRPQRGRRARLHPARDVPRDQGARARARAVRRAAASSEGVVTKDDVDALDAGGLGRAVAPRTRRSRSRSSAEAEPSSSRPASTSSTARPRPTSRRRCRPTACARSTRSCCACPRASPSNPKLGAPARAPARGAGRRGRHRLGPRRGAGLRLAADRGHAGPPHRPGHRARHVLPAPHGPARRQDRRRRICADPEPAGRAGADGAAQLAAVGDGLPGLRVRLLRRRRRRRSCSGRRSSATSSTAPR